MPGTVPLTSPSPAGLARPVVVLLVALIAAAGLATSPAEADHLDLLRYRQEGSVVWVSANVVVHHNPWRCARTAGCRWPDGWTYEKDGRTFTLTPGVPIWDDDTIGYWTGLPHGPDGELPLEGVLLMTQPWRFDDNKVNWDHKDIAVTSCDHWFDENGRDLLSLNCGHEAPGTDRPPPNYPWDFFPEHCIATRDYPNCDVPHRGLHDAVKSADRHRIVGVCIDDDILARHTDKTTGTLDAPAARADWVRKYASAGQRTPDRVPLGNILGWTDPAKQWFAEESGTDGFLWLWNNDMPFEVVHPITGKGVHWYPLHIDEDSREITRSTGHDDTCTCPADDCKPLDTSDPEGTDISDFGNWLCHESARRNARHVYRSYGVSWDDDPVEFARRSGDAHDDGILPYPWGWTGIGRTAAHHVHGPLFRLAEMSDTADYLDDLTARHNDNGAYIGSETVIHNHEYALDDNGRPQWVDNPDFPGTPFCVNPHGH